LENFSKNKNVQLEKREGLKIVNKKMFSRKKYSVEIRRYRFTPYRFWILEMDPRIPHEYQRRVQFVNRLAEHLPTQTARPDAAGGRRPAGRR
jgi:hypothetical protein